MAPNWPSFWVLTENYYSNIRRARKAKQPTPHQQTNQHTANKHTQTKPTNRQADRDTDADRPAKQALQYIYNESPLVQLLQILNANVSQVINTFVGKQNRHAPTDTSSYICTGVYHFETACQQYDWILIHATENIYFQRHKLIILYSIIFRKVFINQTQLFLFPLK